MGVLVHDVPGTLVHVLCSQLVLQCVAAGIYGGMRAAMQIRAMLGEIGCISVSNIFGIPKVHESLDESGKPLNDHMEKYVFV